MHKRILIIEDDPDISGVLQYALEHAGMDAMQANNGMSGLVRAREEKPDLLIVDLGLPDLDGIEIVRRLRCHMSEPIIVLTAYDAVDRKLELLAAGADDYVTKPFHTGELLARIGVQLRHRQAGGDLEVGDLKLNLDARTCSFRDQPVNVTSKEFEILQLLARQPGRVFTRQEILHAAWGDATDGKNLIDVHIGNLRGKLRELGGYGVLRTVRGYGFALKPGMGEGGFG